MLALAGIWASVAVGVLFTVLASFIIAVAGATVRLFRSHQQATKDDAGLREFFFDTPANPRSGVPARKGWTTQVDETLQTLTANQSKVLTSVSEILHEVKPNGGDNLRAAVDHTAATTEKVKQVVEDSSDPAV